MRDADDRERVTPLDLLGVLARQELEISPGLRHLEWYCRSGLLSMLSHDPAVPGDAAVVACGGAMGGLLGPGTGLYHELGVELAPLGVRTLRVSYRRPNDLDSCCIDVAAAVQLATIDGATRVVVLGHSFGGAVAVRVGVALPDHVAGVVTFATQSAGCEIAAGLAGRPLLLFHGDRDEILPVEASRVVAAIAGHGDVVVIEGDGHLLGRSGDHVKERLAPFLRDVLRVQLLPRGVRK